MRFCRECATEIIDTKRTQFCSEYCARVWKANLYNKKEKITEYPSWVCDICNYKIKLDFDLLKDETRFLLAKKHKCKW